MKIVDVRLTVVNVPKIAPEIWVFGYSWGLTSGIIEIETDDGLIGLGELPGGPDIATATQAVNKSIPLLLGESPFDIRKFLRNCWMRGWHHFPYTGNMATAALEMALWDIVGQATNQPIHNLMGGLQSPTVPYYYHLTVQDRRAETVRKEAAEGVRQGFKTMYLKIGFNIDRDVELVRAIRDEVGSKIAIRVDANEGWSVMEATRALGQLDELDLEFVEQPIDMNDLEGLIFLRNKHRTPLGANQSAWLIHQIPPLIARQAADVIVTDPHQLGSLLAFRDAATMCEVARIPFVKHSFGDLGITTAATLHVLGGLNPPVLAHQTHLTFIEHDLLKPRFTFQDGCLTVPTKPGLGVELDRDAVKHYNELFKKNGEFKGGYGSVESVKALP